jgi:hypothetical protein
VIRLRLCFVRYAPIDHEVRNWTDADGTRAALYGPSKQLAPRPHPDENVSVHLKRNSVSLAVGLVLAGALVGCQQDVDNEAPVVEDGATATWELVEPTRLDENSTAINIAVTRLGCAGGITGETLPPEITYEPERVIVRVDVEAPDGRDDSCPGNDAVPLTVQLAEPIGSRLLIDGGCLRPDGGESIRCSQDVRWPS